MVTNVHCVINLKPIHQLTAFTQNRKQARWAGVITVHCAENYLDNNQTFEPKFMATLNVRTLTMNRTTVATSESSTTAIMILVTVWEPGTA
jgi:hypothetical protein